LKAAVNLLDTQPGRRWFFAALYVSEGAPMGFIWWALPTLLARQGVSLADITLLTSTATLPWVFKFIAGPLIDASSVRRVPLRTWILTCQAVMILALVPVALLDWANDFTLLLACLVSHAVFAATQDVAIDTLAIRSVPAEELGRVNGWMQAGMLAGRAAIAAGSLLLVNLAGPAAVIAVLALIIALPMLLVMMAIREPAAPAQDATGARSGLAVIASATAIVGLLIALTAGAGFEFFSTAIGPLLVDIGASDNTVSLFFGLLAPGGLIAGALLSASFTDRLGAGRATGAGVLAADDQRACRTSQRGVAQPACTLSSGVGHGVHRHRFPDRGVLRPVHAAGPRSVQRHALFPVHGHDQRLRSLGRVCRGPDERAAGLCGRVPGAGGGIAAVASAAVEAGSPAPWSGQNNRKFIGLPIDFAKMRFLFAAARGFGACRAVSETTG